MMAGRGSGESGWPVVSVAPQAAASQLGKRDGLAELKHCRLPLAGRPHCPHADCVRSAAGCVGSYGYARLRALLADQR
jgi:hypothetical protein